MTDDFRPRRSLLFVPGLRPDRFPKALEAGADSVCIDLEDAVAADRKDEARRLSLPLFADAADAPVETLLRINGLATADGLRDLEALIRQDGVPDALMIPKVRSAGEVVLLDELLGSEGLDGVRLNIIIETADALAAVHDIARASPRVSTLILGAVDLSADLRCAKTWSGLFYARSRNVHAAARAGIDAMDVPFLDLEDTDALDAETRGVAELGFTGKAAVHPDQLRFIHRHFTPDAETVAQAKRIVDAFAESRSGLLVIDGKLIEKPVIRAMQRTLAIAGRLGLLPPA